MWFWGKMYFVPTVLALKFCPHLAIGKAWHAMPAALMTMWGSFLPLHGAPSDPYETRIQGNCAATYDNTVSDNTVSNTAYKPSYMRGCAAQ